MLISPAYAQAAGGGFSAISLLPLILIFVVFYFLLIRPQQKKAASHRGMIGAIRRGDSIVTGGGIIGKVTKIIDDDRLQVEISRGVKVQVARTTIASVLDRSEPVTGESKKKKKTKAEEVEDDDEVDVDDDGDAAMDEDDDN